MTRREMCLNAAHRLQSECYDRTVTQLARKQRQFNPCPRGLVYTAEVDAGNPRPMAKVRIEVATTHCVCHPGFTQNICLEYEFTPRKETAA